MKTFIRQLFVLLFIASSASALIPDPGNIYYGVARDVFGDPYQPTDNAKVCLVRVVGTVDILHDSIPDDDIVIAESDILSLQGANGVNFVLRPSQDDGTGTARYTANAARANDAAAIFIVEDGIRVPVTSILSPAISDTVPAIGPRGSIFQVNVRANDDYDGNGLSDTWETWFFGSAEVNPYDDDDQDGLDNLSEFLGGTDPMLFNALDLSLERAGQMFSKTGSMVEVDVPRLAGRAYVMEWSTDLVNWTAVPVAKLSGPNSNRADTTSMGQSVFFRYRVSRSN